MADEVKITLEPIRLQAVSNIALLNASTAVDKEKREKFIRVLERLVSELNEICGAGMGIMVQFTGGRADERR